MDGINFMKQIPLWEANSGLVDQEITRLLWNDKACSQKPANSSYSQVKKCSSQHYTHSFKIHLLFNPFAAKPRIEIPANNAKLMALSAVTQNNPKYFAQMTF